MKPFLVAILFFLLNAPLASGQWHQDENFVGGGRIEDFIEFNEALYVATNGNGMFRSTDNGNSWTEVNLPDKWRIVAMAIHKGELVAVVYGNFYKSPDGNNWTKLAAPDAFMKDIISDGNNLYIASEYGIFKSDDDGNTWHSINNTTTSNGINSIAKFDTILYAGGPNGAFFKSADEGQNWNEIKIATDYNIEQIFLINSTIYINISESILKSNDGGESWENITASNSSIFSTLPAHIDGNSIFVNSYGYIFRSDDDGATWVFGGSIAPRYSVKAMYANENTLFLGLLGGGVMTNSRELDLEWRNKNKGLALNEIFEIKTFNNSIFVGTEQSFVKSSNDNGLTWNQEKDRYNFSGGDARSMTILDDYIFIGQGGGGVHRRKLSDNQWETVNEHLPYRIINDLSSNDAYLFAGIEDHGVYRSSDYGNTWEKKDEGITSNIRSIYNHDSLTLVGTWNGIFLSDDNGESWSDISNDIPDRSTERMIIFDTTLFVATQNGGLQKTSDFGGNWQLTLDESVSSISSYNNYIFAGCLGSKLYMSDDLGESWNEISNGQFSSAVLKAIAFADGYIFVGMRLYGDGLWKRALHELMPATLSFKTVKGGYTFRNGDTLFIESDQQLKNVDGSDISSGTLADIISIKDNEGSDVNFTAAINNDKTNIAIFISDPSEGNVYTVNVDSVANTSGLITPQSKSPAFSYIANTPPAVNHFSIEGIKNTEIIIDGSNFHEAFEDSDGDKLEKIVFNMVPKNGRLFLGELLITDGFEVVGQELSELKYQPDEDFVGMDEIHWNAYDGYNFSEEDAVATLTVNQITSLTNGFADSFKVYPNPASDNLNISMNNDYVGRFHIEIFSVTGKKMREFSFIKTHGNIEKTFNWSDLPSGIYFFKLLTLDAEVPVMKIVKK